MTLVTSTILASSFNKYSTWLGPVGLYCKQRRWLMVAASYLTYFPLTNTMWLGCTLRCVREELANHYHYCCIGVFAKQLQPVIMNNSLEDLHSSIVNINLKHLFLNSRSVGHWSIESLIGICRDEPSTIMSEEVDPWERLLETNFLGIFFFFFTITPSLEHDNTKSMNNLAEPPLKSLYFISLQSKSQSP